jgi:hypothetical protein
MDQVVSRKTSRFFREIEDGIWDVPQKAIAIVCAPSVLWRLQSALNLRGSLNGDRNPSPLFNAGKPFLPLWNAPYCEPEIVWFPETPEQLAAMEDGRFFIGDRSYQIGDQVYVKFIARNLVSYDYRPGIVREKNPAADRLYLVYVDGIGESWQNVVNLYDEPPVSEENS